MAIIDAKKRRIGRELVDWIYLGIRTGARRLVEEYRANVATNPAHAKALLSAAVNKPRRARDRINNWIANYDAVNGAGAGQIYLGECLTLAGVVTLAQINTELTNLETQAQTLITNNQSGWTLEQVAAYIEANLEWEAKLWEFPNSAGYTDIELIAN